MQEVWASYVKFHDAAKKAVAADLGVPEITDAMVNKKVILHSLVVCANKLARNEGKLPKAEKLFEQLVHQLAYACGFARKYALDLRFNEAMQKAWTEPKYKVAGKKKPVTA